MRIKDKEDVGYAKGDVVASVFGHELSSWGSSQIIQTAANRMPRVQHSGKGARSNGEGRAGI